MNIASCSHVRAANVGLELVVLNTARVVLVNALEEGVDVSAFNRDLEFGNHVSQLVNGQVPALIQIEIAEDFFEQCRVTTSQLKDAALNFHKEVTNGLLGCSAVLLLWQLPS